MEGQPLSVKSVSLRHNHGWLSGLIMAHGVWEAHRHVYLLGTGVDKHQPPSAARR